MFKKIVIGACFASALLMVSAPANAAAYFIGGKWYYFSLDFVADIAKISGKDLKTGTNVSAFVKIVNADTLCTNPQGKFINPGVGPKVSAFGTSPNVTDEDLSRTENKVKGNVYTTTAAVPLAKDPPVNPCKDPVGVAEWKVLYWQSENCDKGLPVDKLGITGNAVCYRDLAYKNNADKLVYISSGVEVASPADWTFVYLPTLFKYMGTLDNTVSGNYDKQFGACQFPINNEPLAAFPGTAYSLSNPPVNGWAATPAIYYACGPITETQFNAD